MRRILTGLLTLTVVPVAVLAAPVVTPPSPRPHPVPAAVVDHDLALHGAVAAAATGPAVADELGEVDDTGRFLTVGLSWGAPSVGAGPRVTVQVRSRLLSGGWSDWYDVPTDTGELETVAGRVVTPPVFLGASDRVQVHVRGGHLPGVKVVTVDPGTSAADAAPLGAQPSSTATAASSAPTIITRAQWGADESLRTYNSGCGSPSYAGSLRGGILHHTAGSNSYAASDSAAIIRADYAYHVKTNGWCDLGYNFVVDKYGQIFEGRYGGVTKPVIGAHAMGFNTGTVGVSLLGNYMTATPTSAGLEALAQVFAYRFAAAHLDPHAATTFVSGGADKYPAGTSATVPALFSHRDVNYTACPGDNLYAKLPALRDRVAALEGSYSLAPYGNVDAVRAGVRQVHVTGWAIDPTTRDPIQVHVYVAGSGTPLVADVARPDVGAAYPTAGPDHGFDAFLDAPPGSDSVCLYAISSAGQGNTQLSCATVSVSDTTGPPVGGVDALVPRTGGFVASGWALDPDTHGPVTVRAVVDGARTVTTTADGARPEVADAYPAYGTAHGFSRPFLAGVGTHSVCFSALDTGTGAAASLGCRSVKVASAPPVGSLDSVGARPGGVAVSGWALDPAAAGSPATVHVYVGPSATPVKAGASRPDVAAAFPDAGAAHGVNVVVPAPPGPQDVCAYALAVSGSGPNPLLGCSRVTVPSGSPVGSVDTAVGVPGGVRVAGWAVDPDTSAPVRVDAYVDAAGAPLIANASRPDVGAAFPYYGNAHGYATTLAAPPGRHTVCLYAINSGVGSTTQLGCRSVTVIAGDPIGSLDTVAATSGAVRVSGWALDPDTLAAEAVHVYVDATGTPLTASSSRPDIGALYPGYGSARGFAATLPAGAGPHRVCAYALNTGSGSTQTLGCRVVTVG